MSQFIVDLHQWALEVFARVECLFQLMLCVTDANSTNSCLQTIELCSSQMLPANIPMLPFATENHFYITTLLHAPN